MHRTLKAQAAKKGMSLRAYMEQAIGEALQQAKTNRYEFLDALAQFAEQERARQFACRSAGQKRRRARERQIRKG